jgi:hypothetical protein
VYIFAGAYELKGILPLVERTTRRKAVDLLHEYVEKRHSHLSAPLAGLLIQFLDRAFEQTIVCRIE